MEINRFLVNKTVNIPGDSEVHSLRTLDSSFFPKEWITMITIRSVSGASFQVRLIGDSANDFVTINSGEALEVSDVLISNIEFISAVSNDLLIFTAVKR